MGVKTYRGPLWKYVHPFKYLKGEARIARRQMSLDRVLWRVFGPDMPKPTLKTKTTRVTAATRRRDVQRAAKKAAPRKGAAKKTAAKKPGQPAARTTVKRKVNGQFNGREAMPGYERTLFERAHDRAETPPPAVRWTGTRTPRSSR
jgi:hypothetical protein